MPRARVRIATAAKPLAFRRVLRACRTSPRISASSYQSSLLAYHDCTTISTHEGLSHAPSSGRAGPRADAVGQDSPPAQVGDRARSGGAVSRSYRPAGGASPAGHRPRVGGPLGGAAPPHPAGGADRKSTRLNSSHLVISYAVFCLKKK